MDIFTDDICHDDVIRRHLTSEELFSFLDYIMEHIVPIIIKRLMIKLNDDRISEFERWITHVKQNDYECINIRNCDIELFHVPPCVRAAFVSDGWNYHRVNRMSLREGFLLIKQGMNHIMIHSW